MARPGRFEVSRDEGCHSSSDPSRKFVVAVVAVAVAVDCSRDGIAVLVEDQVPSCSAAGRTAEDQSDLVWTCVGYCHGYSSVPRVVCAVIADRL